LLVLALWLPALTTASYTGVSVEAWRWPFASLAIAICVCSLGTAYLRASQLWSHEAGSHTLSSWLLSLQQPEPMAVTAVLCASLWLRVEYVEGGWSGPWERHPARFTFALLLLTPLPHLLGLTANGLWAESIVPRLGFALPASVTTPLLALLYLAVTVYALQLS